jgi:hypothetical protein
MPCQTPLAGLPDWLAAPAPRKMESMLYGTKKNKPCPLLDMPRHSVAAEIDQYSCLRLDRAVGLCRLRPTVVFAL